MSIYDREAYNFYLPKSLIAQFPLKKRDHCKLLVINRKGSLPIITKFFYLPGFLKKGDILIFNNTKVINARLFTKRKTGAKVEVFFLSKINGNKARVLLNPSKRIKIDEELIIIGTDLSIKVIDKAYQKAVIEFPKGVIIEEILKRYGTIPLPPYIKRKDNKYEEIDKKYYQTIFAEKNGSLAAPTAGLHFTDNLIKEIKECGVEIYFITLHIGLGTFKPVKTDRINQWIMEREFYSIDKEMAQKVNEAKREGKRVIAVGTTTVRALESSAIKQGVISNLSGYTELFIYPGFEFKIVDAIITNFHLPDSTLILLISAFLGRERLLMSYRLAMNRGFRFYSYGDAMFIY